MTEEHVMESPNAQVFFSRYNCNGGSAANVQKENEDVKSI